MRKILLVFGREYWTRVRKKSFIIITILVPLSFILMFSIQFFLMAVSLDSLRIAVVDESGQYANRFEDTRSLYFKEVKSSFEEMKTTYQEQNYDGILHIPSFNLNNPKGVEYFSDKLLGVQSKEYIEDELADEIRKERIAQLGIDDKAYQKARKVRLSIKEVNQEGEASGTGLATGVGMFMGMVMYFVIFLYGSMVMRGVMEEKTNRIVEVILSSVKPFQLMMGKILGIGAVGLTQFLIWIILMFFINIIMALFVGGSIDPGMMGANEADIEEIAAKMEMFQPTLEGLPVGKLVFCFLFYFFWGYIVYAALFGAMASAVNEEGDLQTLTIPVSIPIIISIFILMAMINSPNTSLAFWSSIFPLSAPIIMPARIAFGVPTWELILSMTLMVLGAFFIVWVAARIYRIGILMYGKKVTLREIGKWLFYKG